MNFLKKIISIFTNPQSLFYCFLIALAVPGTILAFTENIGIFGRMADFLIPLAAYWLILSLNKRTGIMIWLMFPFTFLSAFQIVLLYLYGRSVIAVDMFLNLTTTNSSEAFELLNNLLPALATVIILYIPVLIGAVVVTVRKQTVNRTFLKKNIIASLIILTVGSVCVSCGKVTLDYYSLKRDLYPVNVFYNIHLAINRSEATSNYKKTSENFSYGAVSERPDSLRETYILVIGETSRADNWQIYGYNRPTNPKLSQRENVFAFTKTLSESNTTHKSVPMLLSPISAIDFEDIYKCKSIITAFKEAGFKTAFISNQRYNNSFIDFFGEEADFVKFVKEEQNDAELNPSDIELLPAIAKFLANPTHRKLIVVHTYGSHFCYNDRYKPNEIEHPFKPDSPLPAKPSARCELINAYDNSIMATDKFLDSLANMLENEEGIGALLYTSDHGEDIFDDSRHLFLHASPIPSYHQLRVPFIFIPNSLYVARFESRINAAKRNRNREVSSTLSFFHTALHIAGIITDYRHDEYALTSFRFRNATRLYLDDHNTERHLRQTGMKKRDFELLDSAKISYDTGNN